MDHKIFQSSVVGYKNILKNFNSQDYLDYKILDRAIICTVADGHSGEFFKYSDTGSKLACHCAIEILEELIDIPKDNILEQLETGTIQKKIYERWMHLVDENYKVSNPVVFKTEYLKYSTTLISTLITEKFRLYLKIGDGSVVSENDGTFKKIINTKNKTIVDSLGRCDSYQNIMYYIEDINESKVDTIILFTDGYENSFKDNEKLYKSLDTTIKNYNRSVFSRRLLKKGYKAYLNKLSQSTSYDDISIIFIMM